MARISSLAEAIKETVCDGDTVALEGFTHLIPHAAGHEIIRQGRKQEIFIIMAQGKRGFVDKLDFVTSIGHVSGGDSRAKLGVKTKGPTKLITDLALFEPDPVTKEMTVVSIHPGVTREQNQENTGWKVRFAAQVTETPPPTAKELEVLRDLHARTKRAQDEAA